MVLDGRHEIEPVAACVRDSGDRNNAVAKTPRNERYCEKPHQSYEERIMRRLPYRWCTLVVFLYLSLSNSFPPAHAGVTEWMDLKVVDGYLMMETEVAGIAGLSIVDTGSQITAINGNFLKSEGLSFRTGRKLTVEGVVGQEKRSTYRQVPATIFGSPVTFSLLVDLELGPPTIQLLLGADFLDAYVFQFDYTNERVRLMTKDAVDLKSIRNIDAKKDRASESLLVKVDLGEDDSAWLQMDTGANGGIMVDRVTASRLDWIGTYPTEESEMSGAVSSGEMESFRVPRIQVGPFGIENVLVSIPAVGETLEYFETITPIGSKFTRRNASEGLLGYDILRHFVVTVDYDRGYVHFYPGEKVAAD